MRYIVALIKKDSDVFMMLNNEKPRAIVGFKSIREGLDYFEDGYNANHNRNYEASMSACIHHMTFQPRVAEIDDNRLEEYVGEDRRAYRISNVSGSYVGVKILPKFHSLYDNGVEPKMIRM